MPRLPPCQKFSFFNSSVNAFREISFLLAALCQAGFKFPDTPLLKTLSFNAPLLFRECRFDLQEKSSCFKLLSTMRAFYHFRLFLLFGSISKQIIENTFIKWLFCWHVKPKIKAVKVKSFKL